MRTLNLGILAHVDAGKTSLTERLLFAAGVIDETGSVDEGTTQTDTLALERSRGITIKSAVVSFVIDDVLVNLIDTPGHPDLIAEVERVLNVLDGAILVISAVEGLQAQTRLLMRALQRIGIPTIMFVNKVDRLGARYGHTLRQITDVLTPAVIAMGLVDNLGTRSARFTPFEQDDDELAMRLLDVLTEQDESLLAAYVEDENVMSYSRLRALLAEHTRKGAVYPVFFGSAVTNAGVDALTQSLTHLLPTKHNNAAGPVRGNVFKIARGLAGEKIAYVRMSSGTVRVRERLQFGDDQYEKVTAIRVFDGGTVPSPSSTIVGGQIGQVLGLNRARIGDAVGASQEGTRRQHFPPPTLETVIVPRRPSDKGALRVALDQLAEQDPLINVRQEDTRRQMFLSLYGEVQKDVIRDTLANDYGIEVEYHESATICIERPIGTGAAVEILGKGVNPFLATVGLRVDAAPFDSGNKFELEVELGSIPLSFHKVVEETVAASLQCGLYGWQVTDCAVTMTHSGYLARQSAAHGSFDKSMSSTASDFRHLTPLVVMSALKSAGTQVYEPILTFHLEAPIDSLGAVLKELTRLGSLPKPATTHDASCAVEGEIPAARLHEFQQRLPGLTRGQGVMEHAFDSYQPVRGSVPVRARSDHNPLNRAEYLLHVNRRF